MLESIIEGLLNVVLYYSHCTFPRVQSSRTYLLNYLTVFSSISLLFCNGIVPACCSQASDISERGLWAIKSICPNVYVPQHILIELNLHYPKYQWIISHMFIKIKEIKTANMFYRYLELCGQSILRALGCQL